MPALVLGVLIKMVGMSREDATEEGGHGWTGWQDSEKASTTHLSSFGDTLTVMGWDNRTGCCLLLMELTLLRLSYSWAAATCVLMCIHRQGRARAQSTVNRGSKQHKNVIIKCLMHQSSYKSPFLWESWEKIFLFLLHSLFFDTWNLQHRDFVFYIINTYSVVFDVSAMTILLLSKKSCYIWDTAVATGNYKSFFFFFWSVF